MKINGKWQGILVIIGLSLLAIGLAIFWFKSLPEKPEPIVESTRPTITVKETDASLEDKKRASTLGIIGEYDDPKFEHILRLVQNYNYQGTVLLVKDGQPVWQQGFGEMTPNVPYDPDAPIALTSISKNVTAYLVMQEMSNRGKSLDTKLSEFYPNLPGSKKVTIRDLIRMDAGYHGKGYPNKEMTEKEYLNYYLKNMTYNPDKYDGWRYNATDYQVLTNVLAMLTKTSYNDLITTRIKPKYDILTVADFEKLPNHPVGMNADGSVQKFNPQIFNREVGTGSLFMSPWETYRFISDEIQGKSLTSQEFSDLTKPRENEPYSYSAGMYKREYGYLLHGKIQGFEPSMVLDHSGKNGVILFSNKLSGNIDVELGEPIFKELMAMQ